MSIEETKMFIRDLIKRGFNNEDILYEGRRLNLSKYANPIIYIKWQRAVYNKEIKTFM